MNRCSIVFVVMIFAASLCLAANLVSGAQVSVNQPRRDPPMKPTAQQTTPDQPAKRLLTIWQSSPKAQH